MKILKGLTQRHGWNVTADRDERLQRLVANGTLTAYSSWQADGPVHFVVSFMGRGGAIIQADMSGPEAEAFLLGVNAEKTRVHYALAAPGQAKVNR